MDFSFLTEQTSIARMAPFLVILVAMSLLEVVIPNVERQCGRSTRWFGNLSLVVLGSLSMRLVFGAGAAGAALWAEQQGYGLLPMLGLDIHAPVIVFGVVLLLDFAIYAQHAIFHRIPMVWHFHAVHHADPDLDVTSGLRFHPVEYVLSMAVKIALVVLIGAPAEAVILFEIILNATALFSHSNIKLPAGVDRVLRLVIVTPDMHRVHHKTKGADINSNFGFSFSIWDRLCGTYSKTVYNHDVTGLHYIPVEESVGLWSLLVMPFKRR